MCGGASSAEGAWHPQTFKDVIICDRKRLFQTFQHLVDDKFGFMTSLKTMRTPRSRHRVGVRTKSAHPRSVWTDAGFRCYVGSCKVQELTNVRPPDVPGVNGGKKPLRCPPSDEVTKHRKPHILGWRGGNFVVASFSKQ